MLTSLAAVAPLAHWAGHGFAFWPLFVIGHLFWFVIIVLVIIFAVTGRRRRHARWAAMGGTPFGGFGGPGFGPWSRGAQAAHSAEATLAERFAQGDIDEKEYRARLEVLRANNPSGPTAQG